MSVSKKRKFAKHYLQYGFTNCIVNGVVVPKCVICLKNSSNDALRPKQLQNHLKTKYSSLRPAINIVSNQERIFH